MDKPQRNEQTRKSGMEPVIKNKISIIEATDKDCNRWDEFAKDVGEYSSLQDLKDAIKKRLEEYGKSKIREIYFSEIISMDKMVGHIYGRANVMTNPERPNMFLKEISIYIKYLKTSLAIDTLRKLPLWLYLK